jgi:hypothetical protein
VLVAVALVVVLAIVILSGDEESGVEGRVLSSDGVCAHSTPDLEGASTTPRGAGCVGLDHGETFRAACVQGNTLRIAAPDRLKGDYITRDPRWVELSDEVPPCD